MRVHYHIDPGKEIRSISGYMSYIEEARLEFRGRKVLFAVGVSVIDNSCCGPGGARFLEVSGYVSEWEKGVDESGRTYSLVEPVADTEERKEILSILNDLYPHSQITFSD
ncbi:MAG: hypothetical protein PHG91_04685 [Syntrophales bacterium]|nr:hypothetical protein [Syntrophales bacterium]MDD5232672.1 hypothetical protein [Syntrophales bacterium]MDD5533953.1 hypothetical protein [Syntrophales bacterium]HPL64319.1 hypothetical protein [Syntrophales bacterium]